VPQLLLEWRPVGMSDDALFGFILLIVGLILADTMPAAAYFYTSRLKRNRLAQIKEQWEVRFECNCLLLLLLFSPITNLGFDRGRKERIIRFRVKVCKIRKFKKQYFFCQLFGIVYYM
jgi:hypothetical protein